MVIHAERGLRMDVEVAVRWHDVDALGHVNHAVYLTYFEEQRDRWLGVRVGLGGSDYVVAGTQVEYMAPIAQEDGPLRVSGSIARLGRSSLTLDAELRSARGQLCARSRTSIVLWDAARKASRPLSEREREALKPDLRPDAGPATAPPSPLSR